jgi:Zn-dependent M32 family carboxypeptidase
MIFSLETELGKARNILRDTERSLDEALEKRTEEELLADVDRKILELKEDLEISESLATTLLAEAKELTKKANMTWWQRLFS